MVSGGVYMGGYGIDYNIGGVGSEFSVYLVCCIYYGCGLYYGCLWYYGFDCIMGVYIIE